MVYFLKLTPLYNNHNISQFEYLKQFLLYRVYHHLYQFFFCHYFVNLSIVVNPAKAKPA